jgi:hypothetical protein
MKTSFDHEKLSVYQEAIRCVAWAGGLLETHPKSLAAYDQLDRASTSIAVNIGAYRLDAGGLDPQVLL